MRKLYARFIWYIFVTYQEITIKYEVVNLLPYPRFLHKLCSNEWYRKGCDECRINSCKWPKGICLKGKING